MLQQLANQLQAAEGRPVYRDNLVPFIVLFTFLLTFWVTYSGVAEGITDYLDLRPRAFAATSAAETLDPSITINGFTFDHSMNRDYYYNVGYGYPK